MRMFTYLFLIGEASWDLNYYQLTCGNKWLPARFRNQKLALTVKTEEKNEQKNTVQSWLDDFTYDKLIGNHVISEETLPENSVYIPEISLNHAKTRNMSQIHKP